MKDLISILIPVYNRQDVLGECIASITSQSNQNFEIILIDDGSTDSTPELCRELASRDPRIILLEGAHRGVSAARNRGLEVARGEYVLFVDSDDVIHPLLLEELAQQMRATGAPMGGSNVISVSEKNWHKVRELLAKEDTFCGTTYQSHDETLHAVFHGSTPLNMIGGVMIRRDWIGQTRFREDLTIGEDFYFIYENLAKGTDTVFLKKARYYSRLHATNTSWDFGFTGFWSRFFRRELVWKNEEALGRTEYADRQKQGAFGSFLICLRHNKPSSEDSKRMRQVLKQYKSTLFPVLSWKDKIRYCLSVYTPAIYLTLSRIKSYIKKLLKK